MALTDPIAIPAGCGCCGCDPFEAQVCVLCPSRPDGGIVPLTGGGTTPHIFATASGFDANIAAQLPSAYAGLLAAMSSPVYPTVNGSFLLNTSISGTVRSYGSGSTSFNVDTAAGYTSAQISAMQNIYNAEAISPCSYTDPFPGIAVSPGAGHTRITASADETLIFRLGCRFCYRGYSSNYRAATLSADYVFRYSMSWTYDLDSSSSVYTIRRQYSRSSYKIIDIAAITCSPFFVSADFSTTDAAVTIYESGVGVGFTGVSGTINCRDTLAFTNNPFTGTVAFSE